MNCLQLEKILTELRLPDQSLDTLLAQHDKLKKSLLSIPSGKRLTLLMTSNDLGSVMHKMAAIKGTDEMIECMTDCVERQDYYHLMKIQDECGQTALHVAARNSNLNAVMCMLNHLFPGDRVRILEMKDTGYLTAFHHLAGKAENCDWITEKLLPMIEVRYLEGFLEGQLSKPKEVKTEVIMSLTAYKDSRISTPSPGRYVYKFLWPINQF